jgi:1-phosphofructokinase
MDLVCVPVDGAVRMNVSLAEAGGTLTKINASGPRLSDGEWTCCSARRPRPGGMPSGWPSAAACRPARPLTSTRGPSPWAREAGCRVAVDSSGPSLEAALGAGT